MKNYFASFIIEGVAGVTQNNTLEKPNEYSTLSEAVLDSPVTITEGNGGSRTERKFPLATPQSETGMATEVTVEAVLPALPHVSPSTIDWQEYFDERAGILEFDAGFPREQAERLARQEIMERKRI